MAFTRRLLAPRPDAPATLAALKAAGLKLALMSVCSAEVPHLWPATPMAPYFDAALFPCREGLTKPEPRFYALACRRLGVPAGRCLYVGNGASGELTGAAAAGMHPVLIGVAGDEDYVLERDDARDWPGPTVARLGEVVGLATG